MVDSILERALSKILRKQSDGDHTTVHCGGQTNGFQGTADNVKSSSGIKTKKKTAPAQKKGVKKQKAYNYFSNLHNQFRTPFKEDSPVSPPLPASPVREKPIAHCSRPLYNLSCTTCGRVGHIALNCREVQSEEDSSQVEAGEEDSSQVEAGEEDSSQEVEERRDNSRQVQIEEDASTSARGDGWTLEPQSQLVVTFRRGPVTSQLAPISPPASDVFELLEAGADDVEEDNTGGEVGNGGSAKKRGKPRICKYRCDGCLRPNCNRCFFCLNSYAHQRCVQRKCIKGRRLTPHPEESRNPQRRVRKKSKAAACPFCGKVIKFAAQNMKRHKGTCPKADEEGLNITDDFYQTKDLLDRLQLSYLEDLFRKEKITVEILSDMTHDDLKQIGITAFGDRHKLVKAAKSECAQTVTSSASDVSEQLYPTGSVSQTRRHMRGGEGDVTSEEENIEEDIFSGF